MISKTSSARRVHYFKIKALKKQEEMVERLDKVAFQEALARKATIAEIERQIAKVSNSCGSSLRSISPVGSQDDNLTKDSGCMDITETAEYGAKSNIVVTIPSKSENAGKLVHEGKFSAPMRDSTPLTEADEEADWNDRTKAENRACRRGANHNQT